MTHKNKRDTNLRRQLVERQREMRLDMHSRIRDERTGRPTEVGDAADRSDAITQGDMDFALMEMRAETVARIDEALLRLDAGKYGTCFECDGEIAERRLRALPFAVRCQACQEQLEQQQGRKAALGRRDSFTAIPDDLRT